MPVLEAIDYFAYIVYDELSRDQMPTAAEVENRFDEYLEKARYAPVVIEKNERISVVILNYDDYEHLQALDDYCWAMAADEAQRSGYIGTEEAMKLLTRYKNT